MYIKYSEICIETQRSGRSEDITANTGFWLANMLPQEGPGSEYLQEMSTSFLALNAEIRKFHLIFLTYTI